MRSTMSTCVVWGGSKFHFRTDFFPCSRRTHICFVSDPPAETLELHLEKENKKRTHIDAGVR